MEWRDVIGHSSAALSQLAEPLQHIGGSSNSYIRTSLPREQMLFPEIGGATRTSVGDRQIISQPTNVNFGFEDTDFGVRHA